MVETLGRLPAHITTSTRGGRSLSERSITFGPGESQGALTRLKFWCLKCTEFASKDEQASRTGEWLDEAEAALPPPPR